jgi:NADH-quinone oxidoreductase subunit B
VSRVGRRTGLAPTAETSGRLPDRVRIPGWVRPLILDLGCCGTSALQVCTPGCSLPGFEGSAYDLDPEQANVLVVAGRVPPALVPTLQSLYDRAARPRWVIAYGTCAISGAVLETVPTERIVPVDVLLPGCPPHPAALCKALARVPRRRM